MLSADLVLRGGSVVTMDAAGTVLPEADVAVADGAIVAVGPALEVEAARVLDVRGCAVTPGFVNAHTHQCLLRGTKEDRPLETWLDELCFPMEHALQPSHTVAAAQMNQIEMIRSGTTTFVDMYRHLSDIAPIVDRSGLRAVLAPQIMDVGNGRGETWEEAEDFVRAWAGQHPRIDAWVGPHAPYTVHAEGYLRARRLADEVGTRVMTHLCETRFEVEEVTRREGVGPVEWLDRLGVLDGLLGAHGVWLSDDDRERLARRGASIVHNPSSNMKLASGVAEVGKAKEAGVAVGLGTDSVLSNNNLDLIEEARLASFLQKVTLGDATALPAAEALRLATMGGAEAIGMADRIGSIEVGKRADLVVISLEAAHMWPVFIGEQTNIVEQIVYSASAADVRHTIVDGVPLMLDRELLTLDEAEASEAVRLAAADLIGTLPPTTPYQ